MKVILCPVPLSNPLAIMGEPRKVCNALALGYLAAALKANKETENDEVVILDREALLHNLKTLTKDIIRHHPDVLGISVYIWNYQRVLHLCKMVKTENPGIIIVLGGPQVTFTADTVLQNKCVDIIVRGEGEVTFCELIKALKTNASLHTVCGISFKYNNTIVTTPDRQPIQPLDTLPSPYLSGDLDLSLSERLQRVKSCPR